MHSIHVGVDFVIILIKQNAEGQETTVEIDIAGEKVLSTNISTLSLYNIVLRSH